MPSLFLFSYETKFIQKFAKDKIITEAKIFNLTFIYIDDIHHSNVADWIPLKYLKELLEIKETTETASSVSFLDLYLKTSLRLYDKRGSQFSHYKHLTACNIPTFRIVFGRDQHLVEKFMSRACR